MTSTISSPPPTPVEPVSEILHGVTVTDPYRWLEDQSSPSTRKWLEEQNAYTHAYLEAIPGRERIRERIAELLAVETISEPWCIGRRLFYLKRRANQEQPAIVMRDSQNGNEVILLDPTERIEDCQPAALGILNISRDGHVLAYSVRHSGRYSQAVGFLDVDNKRIMSDQLPVSFRPIVVLSADGQGFYYSHEPLTSTRPYHRAAYWHQFGTDPETDKEIFTAGEEPKLHLGIYGSVDGCFLAYRVTRGSDPPTFELYAQDMSSKSCPRKVVEGKGLVFEPVVTRDKIIALTDWKAPNLRVIGIDQRDVQSNRWFEVVPESEYRIKDFAVIGSSLFVDRVANISSRIEVFDLSGHRRGVVECPSTGSVRLFRRPVESDILFYEFSSFGYPPTIFSYDPTKTEQKVWAGSQLNIDRSSIQVNELRCRSKDNTLIPLFAVAQKHPRFLGPSPAYLTAYGGFGTSRTPEFSVYSTFLINHGFVFAVANVRGGGEFGDRWHCAGKRHNRQNAINDFIAVAEWLCARGYAEVGKIAIGGGSNAGLLVGAALTQRPDLFRVVVCLGPILDMLRYHLFDFAHSWIDEYGSSENEDDFRYLLAYSPYHSVENTGRYPAVMLVSGDADNCCNPMHARKMAARLQAATHSHHPILLDYRPFWGHAPVQSLNHRIEALTDRLAFICHELGVRV